MFNYFESVNLTPESVELYKLWKSVKINSVRVNLTLDFLLCVIKAEFSASLLQSSGSVIIQKSF